MKLWHTLTLTTPKMEEDGEGKKIEELPISVISGAFPRQKEEEKRRKIKKEEATCVLAFVFFG